MTEREIRWLDITTIGSNYDHQVSECGRYERHRPRTFSRPHSTDYQTELPWVNGPPPKPKDERS